MRKIRQEFFEEFYRDLSSDRRCELYFMDDDEKELQYRLWLEKQLSKFVNMKNREGYRR